jgi:hypothetical protein
MLKNPDSKLDILKIEAARNEKMLSVNDKANVQNMLTFESSKSLNCLGKILKHVLTFYKEPSVVPLKNHKKEHGNSY